MPNSTSWLGSNIDWSQFKQLHRIILLPGILEKKLFSPDSVNLRYNQNEGVSMKRVTYISRFSRPLTGEEIQEIAEVSIRNNQKDGLTGILFSYKDVFYQIIEGPSGPLDARLEKIFADGRHRDLFVLKVETDVLERDYQDWAMKTVILDESQDFLMRPVSEMLGSITDTWMILEKYTPEQILRSIQLGENPLKQKAKPVQKIILFGDLFASTTFSERLDSSLVFSMLEAFFEIAIETIQKYGGSVSKLMGDGLMAVFHEGEESMSIDAVKEISTRLRNLRESRSQDDPFSLLYAGFGLSAGKVLEGNVGSISKKDYTYLGDTVNTASRLQGVTRNVGRSLVFDGSLLERGEIPGVRRIGRYIPRGKEKELLLYTINDPVVKLEMEYEALKKRIQNLSP